MTTEAPGIERDGTGSAIVAVFDNLNRHFSFGEFLGSSFFEFGLGIVVDAHCFRIDRNPTCLDFRPMLHFGKDVFHRASGNRRTFSVKIASMNHVERG